MNKKLTAFNNDIDYTNFISNINTNDIPNVSYVIEDNMVYFNPTNIGDINCIVVEDATTGYSKQQDAWYNGTFEIGGEFYYKWREVGETSEYDDYLTEVRNPLVGGNIGRLYVNRYGDIVAEYFDVFNIVSVYSYPTEYADIIYKDNGGIYRKINGSEWNDSLGEPIGVEVISGDETSDGKTVIVDFNNINNNEEYVWGGYTKVGTNSYTYQDIAGLSPVDEGYGHLDMDGLGNTNKIIAALGDTLYNSKTYAAKAARATSADGQVEWYLPSSGEAIMGQRDSKRINNSLNLIGEELYWDRDSWLSSLRSDGNAWDLNYGGVDDDYGRYDTLPVRRFGRLAVSAS